MVDLSKVGAGDTVIFACGARAVLPDDWGKQDGYYSARGYWLYTKSGETFESGPFDIVNVEKKPFKWEDVKVGMAFKEGEKIYYYAAPFFMQEDTHVIIFEGLTHNGYPHSPRGTMKKFITRAPEHDIEVKS